MKTIYGKPSRILHSHGDRDINTHVGIKVGPKLNHQLRFHDRNLRRTKPTKPSDSLSSEIRHLCLYVVQHTLQPRHLRHALFNDIANTLNIRRYLNQWTAGEGGLLCSRLLVVRMSGN